MLKDIKSDIQNIINKHRGGCLCTMRESCSNCDPFSSGNKLKEELGRYINSIKTNDLTVEEVPCPKCGSENTYTYNTDECEFRYDTTGHVNLDHACNNCSHRFRSYTNFTYQVTSQSTS